MTRDQLKAVLDRVLTWPPQAQEQAIASLQTIEEQFLGPHEISPSDAEALRRSADDMRAGRFATDEQVEQTFGRFRRA
jgi:hypothetical protein